MIRLEWKATGTEGVSIWYHTRYWLSLAVTVNRKCARYGLGTHRLVSSQGHVVYTPSRLSQDAIMFYGDPSAHSIMGTFPQVPREGLIS